MTNVPNDIEEWNTLEDMLAVFFNLDRNEIYEETWSNAETDGERAGFFDRLAWNVGYYTQYNDILKEEFSNWINEIDVNIYKSRYLFYTKQRWFMNIPDVFPSPVRWIGNHFLFAYLYL